jgi:hypothetical protein
MDWNKSVFIGKVKTVPQVSDNAGRKQAFFKFTLNDRTQGANGQWVDKPMDIDVFARDKKADLIEKYVVAGQELAMECKYINWEADGALKHAFQVLNVSFGFKPRPAEPQQPVAQSGPPL